MQPQNKFNQSQQTTKKHQHHHQHQQQRPHQNQIAIYPRNNSRNIDGSLMITNDRNDHLMNQHQFQHQQGEHYDKFYTDDDVEDDFEANFTSASTISATSLQDHNANKCINIFISECLGTFLFVYLGQSAVTSFELIGTQNETITRQMATIIARSLALLFATMITLKISGAHLNPAYSLASAIFNYNISYSRAFSRICAQYLGAFVGALLLHLTYLDKLNQRHSEGLLIGKNTTLRSHGNLLSTGKFFSSFPPTEVNHFQLFTSYLLANTHYALLAVAILNGKLISNNRIRSSLSQLKPLYLGLSYCLILAAFSANGGPVLNPAQDFSTRFYMLLTSWGWSAFNLYHGHYWWLCGIVAPHAGFIIGFGIYKLILNLQTIPHNRRQVAMTFDNSLK